MPKLSVIFDAFAEAFKNAHNKENKKAVVKDMVNSTQDTGVTNLVDRHHQTTVAVTRATEKYAAAHPEMAANLGVTKDQVGLVQGSQAIHPDARTAPNTSASPDLKKGPTPPTNAPRPS